MAYETLLMLLQEVTCVLSAYISVGNGHYKVMPILKGSNPATYIWKKGELFGQVSW